MIQDFQSDQKQAALSIFQNRQERLSALMNRAKLDAIALAPGPSLTYLSGLHFHLSERPIVLIIPIDSPPTIVLPELELRKLDNLTYTLKAFTYSDDPSTWEDAYSQAAQGAEIINGTIGVEPTGFRFIELRLLEKATGGAHFTSAEDSLAELRMVKDANELSAMRKAVRFAQDALTHTLPYIEIGVGEQQIASELTLQLLRAGSDPQIPFSPIVSAGANGANPHATPTDRLLAAGDLLVIDWGASHKGYFSDLTRTFAIGKIEPEFETIYNLVKDSNSAGRAAVHPGVSAAEIDTECRQVIEKAGYGKYFFHRTGHGLGMEGHEPPYIRSGNMQILTPGMTFTIEPGIYLPGRAGVRIEDDMVVTEESGISLSDYPRNLISIDV